MKQLFSIQKKLDDRILEKYQLNRENLFVDKVVALLTEIGELTNETRCFKYWSEKPASERKVILEEYVDGIHFLLSIGVDNDWTEEPSCEEAPAPSLSEQFLKVYKAVISFSETASPKHYDTMFGEYLKLGKLLGFSKDEIKRAYYEKNELNHQRQTEGY
ncbi:dUTP diphosphatase [Bacillus piscicola]|uniref:dUTP diphosphatase n=1 Tax=Bacillus piscicola TaxID=1632684 RepID=UPI001F0952CB|nr:dUTP diphosphatase [Bacillus piscicola]